MVSCHSKRYPGVFLVLSPDSFTSSLDAMSRADLERLRDAYAVCIFWSTAAVVLGCALEVPEVLHEFWPSLFPATWSRTIKGVSSAGLLFVVLGVAGELTFDHWRSGYEGLLQTFENVLVADAEQHTAEAQQRANDAAREAGELGVKVEKLPSFVAQKETELNGDIARFQTYANRIQQESTDTTNRLQIATVALDKASEDAKNAAARAEIELAKIQAANAPRTLTGFQQTLIVSRLRPMGSQAVDIFLIGDAPEIANLTNLLAATMSLAGWKPKYVGKAISAPNIAGVFVGVHLGSDAKTIAAAEALMDSLNNAGIRTSPMPQFNDELPMAIMGTFDSSKVSPIRMYVSAKP
jgi:hypothetical protein